jgi:hypothetical protein
MALVDTTPGGPGSKLPLGRTIGLAYSTYFGNFVDVLRISWLWLVVVGLLSGFASWLQFSWMASVLAGAQGGLRPGIPNSTSLRPPIEAIALQYTTYLLLLFAGVSIAVAWHRRLILDEAPGLSGSNVATHNVWRYVGMALAIVLITTIPAAVIIFPIFFFLFTPIATGGVSAPPGAGFFFIFPVVFIVFAAVMAVGQRLSVLLPARAIGNVSLTFKEAWTGTRGNTWRLFWGYGACTIPPLMVAQIISIPLIISLHPGPTLGPGFAQGMAIFSAIFTIYYLLVLPIAIGFLSHAYRYFSQTS